MAEKETLETDLSVEELQFYSYQFQKTIGAFAPCSAVSYLE